MPYTKQTWKNGSTGGTPLNKDRLGHMEDGIQEASDRLGVLEARSTNPNGLLGWAYDPLNASQNTASGVTFTSGTLYLMKMMIPVSGPVTNIFTILAASGTGLTTGQNLVGLYSAGGALLGQAADQTTAWQGATGVQTMPLTSPVNVVRGFHYVGLLSVGTTLPGFSRNSIIGGAGLTVGLTSGNYRQIAGPTGQTSLPSSVTMSSGSASSWVIWCAVS